LAVWANCINRPKNSILLLLETFLVDQMVLPMKRTVAMVGVPSLNE
jgi:hypothetical protein